MTAVPTFVVGKLRAANLQQLATVVGELKAPHRVQARQIVAQTLTTGTGANITFTAEDVDSANGHSTSSNTDRYVIPATGLLMVAGGVGFAVSAAGVRLVLWRINGVDVNGSETLWSASSAFATGFLAKTMFINVVANDILTLVAVQTTGGNLDTDVGAATQSTMTAWMLSMPG